MSDREGEEFHERAPSWLMAPVPCGPQDAPTVSEVIDRAGAALPLLDWAIVPVGPGRLGAWRAKLTVAWDSSDKASEYEVWLQKQSGVDGMHFEEQDLSAKERDQAGLCSWGIGIETRLGGQPLDDFHRQLKALRALAPNAPGFFDQNACVARSAAWLREAAENQAPPHSHDLFGIHVLQQSREGKSAQVWLHTHGLPRCGSLEFELIGAHDDDLTAASDLLKATAMMAIERGPSPPGALFSPGLDVTLEWVPWPEAGRLFRGSLGARPEDRDDYHRMPSGVLVERRGIWPFRWHGYPRRALEAMRTAPVLYLSKMETARMEQLAALRFSLFRGAFDRHSETQGWGFFIKFGYAVEEDGAAPSREHLWLKCRRIDETKVFGELLNEPCFVSQMNRGQRDWDELALMTDWRVETPDGGYDPDTIETLCDSVEESPESQASSVGVRL